MEIHIKNLKVKATIGVNEKERLKPQELIINVFLDFDSSLAANSDNLSDTIDYYVLEQKITCEATTSKFYLIERLADSIIKIIMEYDKIKKAVVEIDKPNAIRLADSVSVRHTIKRD